MTVNEHGEIIYTPKEVKMLFRIKYLREEFTGVVVNHVFIPINFKAKLWVNSRKFNYA